MLFRVAVFLLVLMLVPVLCVSELNEYDLNGVWTCYIYEKDPETDSYFHMYQFIFDGKYCQHFIYDYYLDSPGYFLSPHDTGSHYFEIDGAELLFKEHQTSTDVQFTGRWSGGFLYISFDGSTWRRFSRSEYQSGESDIFTSETVPDGFPSSVYEKLDEGYEIPPGIYIIGKDIPSGDYEISAVDSSRFSISVSQKTKATPTTFDVPAGGLFGKVSLRVGNVFAFSPGSIILKTYHGLFE